MASVRIEPSVRAWDGQAEDYRALADDLSDQGLDVTLVEPQGEPKDLPAAAGMDFLIHVLEGVVGETLFNIGVALIRRVGQAAKGGGRETPIMGVIYGPDGEIIREVELHPPEFDELGGPDR
jgi:hypothetical protein